jgi:hypothetical protein
MFKPLPLNPPLPLLRWSNDQIQSRDLHGCLAVMAMKLQLVTVAEIFRKKKVDTSFCHDKTMLYVYSRTCHTQQKLKNAHNFVHMDTSIVPLAIAYYCTRILNTTRGVGGRGAWVNPFSPIWWPRGGTLDPESVQAFLFKRLWAGLRRDLIDPFPETPLSAINREMSCRNLAVLGAAAPKQMSPE